MSSTPMPTNRTQVDRLKKDEAVALLEELGKEVPKNWTAPEVKGCLKDVLFPKTDQKSPLTGLTKLNKRDLQARCEEAGADFTKNHTRET